MRVARSARHDRQPSRSQRAFGSARSETADRPPTAVGDSRGDEPAERATQHRRVEIVHESLLSAWPRLVRWQTQDQEGAQLRDELRQAARMWEQHERSEDLLWSGRAFREFQLWRERYPGRLTELEESFGDAMTRHALRRRRRRRFAVTAAFASLLLVLAVVGILWRQSVAAARRAEASTTRRVPTHEGVWPIAVDERGTVLVSGGQDGIVRVGPISGEEPHLLMGHQGAIRAVAISPDGERIASIGEDHTIRIWPMPDLAEPPLHTLPRGELLAKLHSLTNLRVVEDPESATGWTTETGPFPGWKEIPTW